MIFAIFLSNYTLSLTSELEHDFRMKIVRYYLNLDVEEFVTESVPDMINRIKSHVNEFVYNGVLPIIRLINEFIVTIFFLVYLFFTDPISVILLFITLSLFIFIYTNLIKRRITQASTDATKGSIKILDLTYNFINGFREILVYNKQDYFIREIERNSRSSSRAQKTHLFYTFIPRYILEFFIFIFIFLLHFTSTYLDSKSSSLVNIGVFGFIALRLIPSLNIALQASSTLRYASVPVERLHADVKKIIEKSKIVNDKVFTELNDKSKFVSLELKNVDFSYNNNKLVLNGLSIKIVSNEFIGIVGESGSGKSTLIDVILGLRKIRNGEYLFNNLNYRYDYSISDYFSYIPQDYFLLDDTLLTNITLENSSQIVNKVKLDDAIEMSQLTNFVKELDDGLSFIIGNGGRKLSGGQRQRLALARAFYFSREILVFDEPTSSLDPDTAKKFMEYLIDLKRTRTVILITHDYDLLRYCDKYFTLRNGNLEETKNYYS
jgi:ABC-type multidrug transport system fused ATPase/permease subunit